MTRLNMGSINSSDLASLIAPHIQDSVTWCTLSQVCKSFHKTLDKKLVRYTHHDLNGKILVFTELPGSGTVHGVKHGRFKKYYKSMCLYSEGMYRNGCRHGCFKKWHHENNAGGLWQTINYQNGKKHGHQPEWYPNGAKKRTHHYIHDMLEGKQYGWYSSGLPEYELDYLNGKCHGMQYYWQQDGEIAFTRNWIHGVLQPN